MASGLAATAIEHAVAGWLAEAVGCAGYGGSLCGGGSAGSLMAWTVRSGISSAQVSQWEIAKSVAQPSSVPRCNQRIKGKAAEDLMQVND
jgi:hypothetical protein